MRIFKQLGFARQKDIDHKVIQDTSWGFYVPGVNSGIYKPATLHVSVVIHEKVAGFFGFTNKHNSANITLNQREFDELFEEMKKIKALQDSLKNV